MKEPYYVVVLRELKAFNPAADAAKLLELFSAVAPMDPRLEAIRTAAERIAQEVVE